MTRQTVLLNEKKEKEVARMKPILIVEDETIMRESLRDWLEEDGYQVETAEHGEEALHRIGEVEFGVVVLDLRLPGKDGLQVLREARAQIPGLKGIIITAYPSVETAVEAMKIGAVDYLPKPFAPDALERLIEETLGPVQVKIEPRTTIEEIITGAPAVEEAEVEEAIAITPEEIPTHLERGREHFETGRFEEAVKEFEAVLQVAPADIETRVLIRKAKRFIEGTVELPEEAEEGTRPKECLWMKMGLVSYRLCTRDYDCTTCEYDQQMQEQMAKGEAPEIEEAIERRKALPGSQRLCRYALKGDVSYRLCSRLYQCATCEFGQAMEDAQLKKQEKLAVRREALLKKAKRAQA